MTAALQDRPAGAAPTGQQMRIVLFHINPIEWPGGCEKYFADLARGLSEQGQQVVLAGSSHLYHLLMCAVYTVFNAVSGNGFHLVRPGTYPPRDLGAVPVERVRLAHLFPFMPAGRRFRAMLHRADVIYSKNEWTDLIVLRFFLPRELMDKVVIGAHSSIFLDGPTARTLFGRIHNLLYRGRFYRRQMRECGAVHCPNKPDAELVVEQYGVPPQKVCFIPYQLEEKVVTEAPVREDEDRAPLRLLFAQRLTQQKGLDYFVELAAALDASPHARDVRFTIAGALNGSFGSLALEAAERFPNVTFRGFVSDMDALYAEHDVVVVPSRWETFSYVVLEAQAAERPVIAFDIPGPNGIVVDGETGWLVPLGDVAALRDVVLRLIEQRRRDPALLRAMGRRGRELALARFGKQTIIHQQIAFLASVAARRAQEPRQAA